MRILVALLIAVAQIAVAQINPTLERKIDALLQRMTLEEKLGQMSQGASPAINDETKDQIRHGRWGSLMLFGTPEQKADVQRIATKESRLGIPILFGLDVIHGFQTIFPIPLGQAASWNPDLIRSAARIAAREATGAGIHWTFAPMIDISRDPRWGRMAESLGEDPYLASTLGAAMVKGFQGDSLASPDAIAACAKHYVGYGAAEAGRDYNTTWIPERLLRDVYLKPFHAARDAGVASFMTSFNNISGIPATGNVFTLRKVLRDEWKFDGLVVSDYTAVTEMIPHGYAADDSDAAMKAIRAGVDLEMVSTTFHDHAAELIKSGKLDIKLIDEAVRNILRVKFRLGLFDGRVAGPAVDPTEARALARQAARESAVLLKNDDGTLPLAKTVKKMAVIGPLADSPLDQNGTWAFTGDLKRVVTPLAAFRDALGAERVLYAAGLKNSRDLSRDGFAAAVEAARGADVVVMFLGEEQVLSGEAHSRAFLNLPGAQEALVDEVAKVGKPVITVILAGRPLIFQNATAHSKAVLYAWHPGTMGGPAIADLIFGDAAPIGRLPVTFPRAVGQVPIYYAQMRTGRPPLESELGIPLGNPLNPVGYTSKYIDVDFTPEYPFGFGLSYTRFEYSNLHVSAAELRLGGTLRVTADVTNTGTRAGIETVQFYVHQVSGSVTHPVRELKGFRRVTLDPGAKQTVEFQITPAEFASYDEHMRLVTEPVAFHVWVAPDAARGLRGEFRVKQ